MYKKTVSGLSFLAAAFGLAAFSAPASAGDCDPNNAVSGGWQCLEKEISPGTYADITDTGWNGPYTFRGDASLSHWAVGSMDCILTATGDVRMDTTADEVGIRVTSLTSGGTDPDCSNVTFGGLTLNYTVPGTNDVHDPDSGSTTDTSTNKLTVYYNGVYICEDYVTLTFGNDINHVNKDGPSYFAFDDSISGWLGSCNIEGTLLSVDVYDEDDNLVSGDVNAW